MAKSVERSIRFPLDLYTKLQAAALNRHVSIAQLVREIVYSWVDSPENLV